MTGIALLTTEGDAYACGLAHGRRFAREIADNVATYLRRFAASGLHREAAFAEAARWHKAIAGHNGAYAEEMRGIADGSGQSEDDIALLNARYELAFTLFGQEARRQRAAEQSRTGEGRHKLPLTFQAAPHPNPLPAPRGEGAHRVCRAFMHHI